VGPEWRVEGTSHVVGTETIFASGQSILDFGIREWHRGVATEIKPVVARTRFVQAITTLMQAENFEKIARKTRYRIGIELAGDPEMFVKNRFQISRYHCFGNGSCVGLAAAREHSLKNRPIQV
jgi:hypothetical protein